MSFRLMIDSHGLRSIHLELNRSEDEEKREPGSAFLIDGRAEVAHPAARLGAD